EHGACGACTVIVDGAAVRSCLMLAVQAEGSNIVTVEGLSQEDGLTPLQSAFRKHHALQCGFCTPGMLTTAHALLTEEPDADEARIPLRLQTSPATEPFRQPVIASNRVRYVGEPVAVVLADSAPLAEDGVEAIALDIEELPAVADRHVSGRHETLIFEEAGTN